MKGLKKIIIAFIIIVILIIITIGILLINLNKQSEEEDKVHLEQVFTQANKLTKIDSRQEYFNVKSCMENYKTYSMDIYYLLEEEAKTKKKSTTPFADRYREELLFLMPKFVKDELDLNEENVYKKVGLKDMQLRIDNIYRSLQTLNTEEYENETEIYAYFVESTLIDRETKAQERNTTIILMDINTYTYYIVPQEYIKQKNINVQEGNLISLYQQKTIPKNEYNGFRYSEKTNIDMAVEYLNNMRTNLTYDAEYVYNVLDEEYRNARFGDIEEFKKYVENNKKTLMQATATKYQIKTTNDYTQYTIVDKNDNYYIFRETGVMEYSLILDTYTIELPEFVEKYNTSNEQQKVALNINKFIEAINKKDYKYAYSKLADSFKQNYFKTQESFEAYVKNNFYEDNKITFKDFGNQATTYIYKTILTNQETKEQKEQSFVVRLGEGTEFEMSFSH